MVPIAPSATTTRRVRASRSEPRPWVGCGVDVAAMIGKPIRPSDGSSSAHYGGPMTGAHRDTVEVAPGVVLAYSVTGDSAGTAAPVVLLHGLSQQRSFWDPVVRRLRAAPVAVLDQRGHGESDTPIDADFSVGACADDVLTLLDRLGWERAIVVGHSWGAAVALAVAARAPERVGAAVLVDGGLWGPSGPRRSGRGPTPAHAPGTRHPRGRPVGAASVRATSEPPGRTRCRLRWRRPSSPTSPGTCGRGSAWIATSPSSTACSTTTPQRTWPRRRSTTSPSGRSCASPRE